MLNIAQLCGADENRVTEGEMVYRVAEKPSITVTPAKAGVQKSLEGMDSCFRRNDDMEIGF